MKRVSKLMLIGCVTFGCVGMISMLALAQQPAAKPAPSATPAKPAATQPSSEDVMNQLLQQKQENTPVEPTAKPANEEVAGSPVQFDPKILGVAPGQEPPKLRREGEFVVSRRGRVVRAASSNHLIFAFDADSEKAPEPPMVLMPCQLLQNMEDLIRERGDKVSFILSGQIFAYRGANYLLPTMMKLAIDQGNIQK